MRQLAEKISRVRDEIEQEKEQPLLLCVLLLREGSADRWDLVLSASWFDVNRKDSLDYVVHKLKKTLSKSELVQIAKIVLLDPLDPLVLAITRAMRVESGVSEIVNCIFNGVHIDHAYVLSARRPLIPARK